MPQQTQPPSICSCDRLVRSKEFMQRLGVGKTTFYELKRQGKLPEPVRLLHRVQAWPESAVAELLEGVKSGEVVL